MNAFQAHQLPIDWLLQYVQLAPVNPDNLSAQGYAVGHNDYKETNFDAEASSNYHQLDFVLSPQTSIKFTANIKLSASTSADTSFGTESSFSSAHLVGGSNFADGTPNKITGTAVILYSMDGIQTLQIYDNNKAGLIFNDVFMGQDYQTPISANFVNSTGYPSNGYISIDTHVIGTSFSANLPITPVPEPETSAMMLLGLAFIGMNIRRNKRSSM